MSDCKCHLIEKGRKLSRKLQFNGLDISIETDKGEERHWHDPHNNTDGVTVMKFPYGYVRRTVGADDEQLDVFVGPNESASKVYVVRQQKAPDFTEYDEDKVMLGFDTAQEAKQAYLEHYNNPKFFGSMDSMSMDEFKDEFVEKAFGQQPGQPGNNPMQPQLTIPMSVDDPLSVEHMLGQIGTMNDKELMKLAKDAWGEGYEYRPLTKDQVRSELRGFLLDQRQLFMLAQMPMMPVPGQPTQQAASSLPLQSSQTGSNNMVQSNAASSTGTASTQQQSNGYDPEAFLRQLQLLG